MSIGRMPVTRLPFLCLRAFLGLAVTQFLLSIGSARGQPAEGAWIKVESPINGQVVNRVQHLTNEAINRRRATVIVYEFQPGDYSMFGSCSDLADVIKGIKGQAETHAYVEKPLKGHAVLPVLMCRNIYMGPDAAIGFDEATLEKSEIDGPKVTKYGLVADNWGRPAALVQKMLDKSLVVYQVELPAKGKQYKLEKELTPEDRNSQPKVAVNVGEAGLYGTKKALEFGLCNREYGSAQELVEALGLPGSVIQDDPLEGRPALAGWIQVKGEINKGMRATILRKINRAILKEGANVLVFEIESPGGAPDVADDLAKKIQAIGKGQHEDFMGKRALTIAYIPGQAAGASTFLALACSQIVMGRNGQLGDCSDLVYENVQQRIPRPENELKPLRDSLMTLAQEQGYSAVLARGLVDPKLVIVPVEPKPDPQKPAGGPRQRIFKDEAEVKRDPEKWIIGPPIKKENMLLRFNAINAEAWGISRHQVENERGLADKYGIETDKIRHLRADWLDELVNVLTHPLTTIFLVIIGFTCLILELKAPGLGLPLIIALVCFVLLFWSHTALAGELNALAILLFLLGLILLGVEIFVTPGFGIPGISGVVLLLTGLSLVMVEKWPQSQTEYVALLQQIGLFAALLLVSLGCAFTLARYLPHIPYANRLVLPAPDEETSAAAASLPFAQPPALLGVIGVVVTTLRPAGKARFGEDLVDVVAEGHFVDVGSRVQVIEIDGVRVIVKAV